MTKNKQKYGISEYKHEFSLNFYRNYGKKGIMELQKKKGPLGDHWEVDGGQKE